jgi:hypothetical protein
MSEQLHAIIDRTEIIGGTCTHVVPALVNAGFDTLIALAMLGGADRRSRK